MGIYFALLSCHDALVLTAQVLHKFGDVDLAVALLQVPVQLVVQVFIKTNIKQLKNSIHLHDTQFNGRVMSTTARPPSAPCWACNPVWGWRRRAERASQEHSLVLLK
jgi:hypothetical protein